MLETIAWNLQTRRLGCLGDQRWPLFSCLQCDEDSDDLPPAIFTLMVGLSVPFIFALTKNWKVDRWIGELSYPVYIVHVVVGAVLAKALNAQDWRQM